MARKNFSTKPVLGEQAFYDEDASELLESGALSTVVTLAWHVTEGGSIGERFAGITLAVTKAGELARYRWSDAESELVILAQVADSEELLDAIVTYIVAEQPEEHAHEVNVAVGLHFEESPLADADDDVLAAIGISFSFECEWGSSFAAQIDEILRARSIRYRLLIDFLQHPYAESHAPMVEMIKKDFGFACLYDGRVDLDGSTTV